MSSIFILNYVLICIICYLVGSIPFSYLILKLKYNLDITRSGSGNAGAMNSYEVSKSKLTGITVLFFDLLKGIIPAAVLGLILKMSTEYIIIPSTLIVLGHNYSVWLKFKGGRGLAPTAGLAIIVNLWLLLIWLTTYFIFFLIKKNVHIANVIATIFLPLAAIFFGDFIIKYNYDYFYGTSDKTMLFLLISNCCILILTKHIKPLVKIIKDKKN